MAHAELIKSLTKSLVAGIVRDSDRVRLDQLADQSLSDLKHQQHGRTNQFEVSAKCRGLVEKFEILNREDLATALQTRLKELPVESGWMPEFLSFLLSLSDRPLERTNIYDLSATDGNETSQEPLTWETIIAEDPFDDPDLWDDVQPGYHSSGDEDTADELDSDQTISTQATSAHGDDLESVARLHVSKPDFTEFAAVESQQHRLGTNEAHTATSEIAVIRETLSMLHGLPTRIYTIDSSDGYFFPHRIQILSSTSNLALDDVLWQCAQIGSIVNSLRIWGRTSQRIPHLQSCQTAVLHLIRAFDSNLATFEQRYLRECSGVVTSILRVRSVAEASSKPLTPLSEIIKSAGTSDPQNFTLLDALYQSTCLAEISNDHPTFSALVDVLLAALRTYLKPVCAWLRSGSCDFHLAKEFFIMSNDKFTGLESIWHDQYSVSRKGDGQPNVPSFMSPFVDRIFSLGKSRAFLNFLSKNEAIEQEFSVGAPPLLEISTTSYSFDGLTSFPQILSDSIGDWVTNTANDCTPLLRTRLFQDHSLLDTFGALQTIFCSQHGALFQAFADTLFAQIHDHNRYRSKASAWWRDTFFLTELAHETLGSADTVEAASLSVSFDESSLDKPAQTEKHSHHPKSSSISQLSALRVRYLFSKPVQNITRNRTSPVYERAFVLLLQTYHAKFLLQSTLPDLQMMQHRQPSKPALSSRHVTALLGLRHQLLWFVDTVHAHLTGAAEVLGRVLRERMLEAQTVDAMVSVWSEHEKQFQTSLLVANNLKPIRDAVVNVLQMCENFEVVWRSEMRNLVDNDDDDDNGNENEDGQSEGEEEWQGEQRLEQRVASSEATLKTLAREFETSLSFVAAGLRGIGRASGDTILEAFSERLGWRP